MKCDRELPCANCKKGGRDGSICYFKDAPTSDIQSAAKRVRLDDGFEERERRPYGGAGYGGGREGEMSGGERGYYPNVPTLARIDPIGPGRGMLAYGMNWTNGVDADIDGIRARQVQQGEDQQRASGGQRERYSHVPAIAREENIGFGRGMFMADGNDEVAGGRRDEMQTPVSSSGYIQQTGARALGRVHVKGTRSRYVGIGDRMAMMDHVSLSPLLRNLTNGNTV